MIPRVGTSHNVLDQFVEEYEALLLKLAAMENKLAQFAALTETTAAALANEYSGLGADYVRRNEAPCDEQTCVQVCPVSASRCSHVRALNTFHPLDRYVVCSVWCVVWCVSRWGVGGGWWVVGGVWCVLRCGVCSVWGVVWCVLRCVGCGVWGVGCVKVCGVWGVGCVKVWGVWCVVCGVWCVVCGVVCVKVWGVWCVVWCVLRCGVC